MERITSRDNDKIKYACQLARSAELRAADDSFFAEGPRLCLTLLAGCQPLALYATQGALEKYPALAQAAVEPVCVSEPVADKLAGVRAHQGVFGVFAMPKVDRAALFSSGRRLLALEGVQDPGNVGTLLRSAAAFGFDGVIYDHACASPFAPKTLRASMGAVAQIPAGITDDLPERLTELRNTGCTCLAAALYDSMPLDTAERNFPGGLCVVIGSEGQGLSQKTIEACSRSVRIPMTDRVESLNAGVAGSVLLWHFRGV